MNNESIAEKESYLYQICTTGMTMVMTFLVTKISAQFIQYLHHPDSAYDDSTLAGSLITLTCLVAIVGIILTLSVAHKEFKMPFGFVNFIIALFFVCLPLFVAADTINSSIHFPEDVSSTLGSGTTNPSKNATIYLKDGPFYIGMSLFITAFVFLLGYLGIVFVNEREPRVISAKQYATIAFFHIAAIVFGFFCIFIFVNSRALVFMSFAALFGSSGYLYFLWGARTSMKENSAAGNANGTGNTNGSAPVAVASITNTPQNL